MNSYHFYCLDDDIDDLELFREAALSLGHTVSLFENVVSMTIAIDRTAPHAIFLDIHMPMIGGEEVLRVLKKTDRWKDIPVMMISSASPKKLVRYYIDSGACGILKKPHGAKWDDSLKKALEEMLLPVLLGRSA